MLDDLQRKLEIGSHGERLRAVRELAEMGSREAYSLLKVAAEDIDPQIRDEAWRAIQANVYNNGSVISGSASRHSGVDDEEGLF
jgi:hypothetical protein